MSPPSAASPIEELFALLYSAARSDYVGESVSQLEHALQTAALAERAAAPGEEVAAALLHDVGHLCAAAGAPDMDGLGAAAHEDLGADYLATLGLPPSVTELVRAHVDAKRYLVAARPDYARRLSAASTRTLAHQGGPMSADECVRFEGTPRFEAALRLRSWDEQAKLPGRRVPALEHYRAVVAGLVETGADPSR